MASSTDAESLHPALRDMVGYPAPTRTWIHCDNCGIRLTWEPVDTPAPPHEAFCKRLAWFRISGQLLGDHADDSYKELRIALNWRNLVLAALHHEVMRVATSRFCEHVAVAPSRSCEHVPAPPVAAQPPRAGAATGHTRAARDSTGAV